MDLADKEFFWLNSISSSQIIKIFDQSSCLYDIKIQLEHLLSFTEICSHIIDFRSSFTATHSHGVAATAEKLARYHSFTVKECKMMRIAGYVHDIGKLSVPVEILNKAGNLNKKEWDLMRCHTYYTYLVLDQAPSLKKIKEWASLHHERLNGDGYPFHYTGESLSIGARIMSVVDVFTAITEDRPYRKGMGKDKTFQVLDDMVKNGALDGNIVETIYNNYDDLHRSRQEVQERTRNYYNLFKKDIDRIK